MEQTGAEQREHTHHPRAFEANRYVYAVLSRRAGGISIGVNLNPDKRCNFDCVYCQVDRTDLPPQKLLDVTAMARITLELAGMLDAAKDGSLFAIPRFADLPGDRQVVRDVAISGDGEPTSIPGFADIAASIVATVEKSGLDLPVTLITNAAGLDRAGVREGVNAIMKAGGRIWAKLDAGTEGYYQTVCATQVPFSRILENITETAMRHPVTLQTCLMRLDGKGPDEAEIAAYIGRVKTIREHGTVVGIQLYTVARNPAQDYVTPLPETELEKIGETVRAGLPGLAVAVFC